MYYFSTLTRANIMALLVISNIFFFKGAYGQNVALGESNAEIGLTSATTTLLLFCVRKY